VFCHLETGGSYRRDKFQPAYDAALKEAGVEGYVRPFHDLRHSSLTNGAAAGEGEVALMTRAGHASMSTTKRYLHLAGVVFREEAERLERRLLAGLSTELSTDLSTPSGTWDDGARLNGAESDASRL
jgi:integrase